MSGQVWEAHIRANEAKAEAMAVMIKSNRSKERVEDSNNQLRDLIKDIRDLLSSERFTNSSAVQRVSESAPVLLTLCAASLSSVLFVQTRRPTQT